MGDNDPNKNKKGNPKSDDRCTIKNDNNNSINDNTNDNSISNDDDNNEKQKQQHQSQLEVIENIPPPPALRILDLSNCDPEAVNDIVVRVDLSQSVSITDASMELLAKYSYKTLESLNINFCPNISDYGLGYLVSKVNVQLKKLGIWGCAQISDVFL